MKGKVEAVLKGLYASEINFSLTTFFDSGWGVKLGDETNGFLCIGPDDDTQVDCDTLEDAVEFLRASVVLKYPDSEFAEIWKDERMFGELDIWPTSEHYKRMGIEKYKNWGK